ncbi:hypothetical protein D9M68_787920 [compost metagenome]
MLDPARRERTLVARAVDPFALQAIGIQVVQQRVGDQQHPVHAAGFGVMQLQAQPVSIAGIAETGVAAAHRLPGRIRQATYIAYIRLLFRVLPDLHEGAGQHGLLRRGQRQDICLAQAGQ